jgi:hypothetical protein
MTAFNTKGVFAAMISLMIIFCPLAAKASSPWQAWPAVGDARLTWGPWVIYDSELRSPDGTYQTRDDQLALVIKYQRSIDSEDLLDATDEQWQHLGITQAKRQKWINQLKQIWPDVRQGDRLIFVLNNNRGVFFRDNQPIGVVRDPEMAQLFLDIWLSPNTAYPDMRRQLIGKR